MSLVLPTFSGFAQPAGGAVGPLSNSLAGSFDGTDDNVDCGVLSAYQGASNMSMSFWFKPDSSGAGPSMGSRTGSTNQWGFLVAGGTNYIQIVTGGTGKYCSFTAPSDTNWHHYVLTFQANTFSLYIDGSAVSITLLNIGSGSVPTLHSESVSFHLGRNATFYSDGIMDEVALWTATLDSDNVTAIYNSGTPTVLSSNAGNYDQSSSLTHWWRVGDDSADTSSGGGAAASGNVIDNVENAANSGTNDGTGSGALYSNEVPVVLPSLTNSLAGSFDGTDDKLTLPNLSFLSGASAFSLSIWFKTSDSNAYLFCSYDSGLNNSIQAYFHSGSSLRFIVGTGSSYYQIGTSSTSLNNNAWHHAVFRFDGGSTIKIYINGSEETTALVSSGTSSVPSATASNAGNNATVADYPTGSYAISSLIDELAFFDKALTETEISVMYNSGVPNDISSLSPVGWWRIGDGTGDTDSGGGAPASGDAIGTVADQGSGGNNATGINGPTYTSTVPS